MKHLILLALITLSTQAQTPTLERVLVPLDRGLSDVPTPGAHGSQWIVTRQIFNANSVDTSIFHRQEPCNVTCVPYRWPARTFAEVLGIGRPGAFYYVGDGGDPRRVAFQIRIQDLTRQALSWGTEIPVVRRTEFSTSGVVMLDVPLDARFRQTLRIYDYAGQATRVAVRIFPMQHGRSEVLVAEKVVELVPPPDAVAGDYPAHPAYAQLGDFLTEFPGVSGEVAVRVEIQPLSPDTPIWAFVAITNNDTQQVTLVTPQ